MICAQVKAMWVYARIMRLLNVFWADLNVIGYLKDRIPIALK